MLTLEGQFVKIIYMRNLISLIFISVFLGGISGCDEPEKKRPADPVPEIKFFDVLPKQTEANPKAINFRIITYRIPLANYSGMAEAFKVLNKDLMRFSNTKSFKANGFAAGIGNAETWAVVSGHLNRIGARRAKTSMLIAYENIEESYSGGNDFFIGDISMDTPTSYFDLSLNSKETILGPGMLGWRIKARDIPDRRGMIQARIQGLYKKQFNLLSRLKDDDGENTSLGTGEIIFKPSSMVMNLNDGDFVLIGALPEAILSEPLIDNKRFTISPKGPALERMRLCELFFRTRGTMIMPKPGAETQTGEVIYKPYKDVEIAEVFVIVSLGVEN